MRAWVQSFIFDVIMIDCCRTALATSANNVRVQLLHYEGEREVGEGGSHLIGWWNLFWCNQSVFLDHHGRAPGDGVGVLRRLVLLRVPVNGSENQPNRRGDARSTPSRRSGVCLRWTCFCFFFEASGARKARAATCIGC